MSTADGTVLGTTKIVDHGPNGSRWNLVILGDGYQSSEMTKYHTDAKAVIDGVYATAPFSEVWCGINIHRVDVVSTDSGADEPVACGGSGATPRTYFDASFCNSGIDRLLEVDSASALNVATTQVPEMNMTFVIVNSAHYGGSGGSVAVFSTHPQAIEIALHEMGHTAFQFADEYDYYASCAEAGHDHYALGEPVEPNVTINTDRNTMKWKALVAMATPMPTTSNADCTHCDPQPNPVGAAVVGTFEGARYFKCGVYRPGYACRMRALNNPYCGVCANVIRTTLNAYITPTSITLDTPSIAFTDIPEGLGGTGVTTYRAIVFEVSGCESRTFQIIAGPTGGFGTPLGTSIVVPPAETTPVGYGRIWLSYTSTTAGSSAHGSVTVQCVETAQTWVINIDANTVARPKSAVVFVLDHSGSMSDDPGDGTTKVQKLRVAATSFIDLMLAGDALGIVRFDDTAQILANVADVGAPGSAARTAAAAIINGSDLDPAGSTSIGDGVLKGKQALDTAQAAAMPPYDTLAMLVLTDGMENTAPFIAGVSGSLTAHTFAIGFGEPENIDVAKLDALTSGHHGYLVVTGAITPDQSHRLTKYFLQVLANIDNASVILDPHGDLGPGDEHRIPFHVSAADYGLDVVLLSPIPGFIDFTIETPGGETFTVAPSSPNVRFVAGHGVTYYRIGLPADPAHAADSHEGVWTAVLRWPKKGQRKHEAALDRALVSRIERTETIPYDLVVHGYSALTFSAVMHAKAFLPGSEIVIAAKLKQYDMPLDGRAKVWADVEWPDGTRVQVILTEFAPGAFATTFTGPYPGLYRARIRALGETIERQPFTREQTRTVALVRGNAGQISTPYAHATNCCCDVLRCVFSALTAENRKNLSRFIDAEALEDCLARVCRAETHEKRDQPDPRLRLMAGGEIRKIIEKIGGR
jgi:hypothetical protein